MEPRISQPRNKECTRLHQSLFLFFYPGAKLLFCRSLPPPLCLLSTSRWPLSPLSFAVSQLSTAPCSHSLSSLRRSPLLQTAGLNLNDTLVGGKKSLSDLILLVSPFWKSCRYGRGVWWSVRDRDGRESSLVEYLKNNPSLLCVSKGGTCIFTLYYICL